MKLVEAKMVLLGSQGVGKTSLIVNFVGQTSSQLVSPTIGASFFSFKINYDNTIIKLQVWDTAGQERFRAMAPMYYRNATIAFIIFDLTHYETFESVKTWVKELHRNIQESIIMFIIGNKNDLISTRQVTQDEALAYAFKIGAEYHETSALENDGVEELFFKAGMEIKQKSENKTSLRLYDFNETTQNTTRIKSTNTENIALHSNEKKLNTRMRKSYCCSS